MLEQTNFTTPIEVTDAITVAPKMTGNLEANRYIVLAGDFMPPATKRNLNQLPGIALGGFQFNPQETPGLWKFHYLVSRGRITPILKSVVRAHVAEEISQKAGKGDRGRIETEGGMTDIAEAVRTVHPGSTMGSLMNEHYWRRGFVEIESLSGILWDTGIVQELQELVFPNWNEYVLGREQVPFTLREFEAYIESRREVSDDSVFQDVLNAFIASADKYRIYGLDVIQKAEELVKRGANDKGYMNRFTGYHRHLAAVLEVTLEDKPTVIVQGGTNGGGMSAEEIELRKREIALKERELELLEQRMAARQAPVTAETGSDTAETEPAPPPKTKTAK